MVNQSDIFVPASEQQAHQRKIDYLTGTCRDDFCRLLESIDGTVLKPEEIVVKLQLKPHTLPKKPRGSSVVGVLFWKDGICLGIVASETKKQIVREYSATVKGTLGEQLGRFFPSLGVRYVPGWMRRSSDRIDFFFSAKHGPEILELFRLFLSRRLSRRVV